jgi:hypothetical protein
MSATVFYGTIDSTMIPVPVIASYDTEGNILPLYLGYKGESYKILSATFKPEYDIKTFQCKIDVYGRVRNVTLSYHPCENVWTIPRQPRNR